jgi:hypothetical protein
MLSTGRHDTPQKRRRRCYPRLWIESAASGSHTSGFPSYPCCDLHDRYVVAGQIAISMLFVDSGQEAAGPLVRLTCRWSVAARNEGRCVTMPDPTQSDPVHSESTHSDPAHLSNASPSTGRWLAKLPIAMRADRPAELNDDLIRAGRPSRRRRLLVAATRVAATFCIGVAATLAWQPYGDAARMMIANASPQLGWLAPPVAPGVAAVASGPQLRAALSSDLDMVRERIDRIAITQEQITRVVAQLTVGQEQIAKEIEKVREVEQYLLYKTSYKGEEVPPARPVTAPAGNKPARRSSSLAAH